MWRNEFTFTGIGTFGHTRTQLTGVHTIPMLRNKHEKEIRHSHQERKFSR